MVIGEIELHNISYSNIPYTRGKVWYYITFPGLPEDSKNQGYQIQTCKTKQSGGHRQIT